MRTFSPITLGHNPSSLDGTTGIVHASVDRLFGKANQIVLDRFMNQFGFAGSCIYANYMVVPIDSN